MFADMKRDDYGLPHSISSTSSDTGCHTLTQAAVIVSRKSCRFYIAFCCLTFMIHTSSISMVFVTATQD